MLVGRRIVCSGGIACQWVADFLLTSFSLALSPADYGSCSVLRERQTETAGTSRGGAVQTRRGTWSGDG